VRPGGDVLGLHPKEQGIPTWTYFALAWVPSRRLFDIGADGGLSGRRVWADLGDAAPDGICLDAEGAAWYADVPHQHCVRVAEAGQWLATVPLDRGGFACMLGGTDGNTLYVVAARWPGMAGLGGDAPWEGQVLRTQVTVPGAGWPAR